MIADTTGPGRSDIIWVTGTPGRGDIIVDQTDIGWKLIGLPLADISSPGKIDCSCALRDAETLLGFNAHGGHMRARALRHAVLS